MRSQPARAHPIQPAGRRQRSWKRLRSCRCRARSQCKAPRAQSGAQAAHSPASSGRASGAPKSCGARAQPPPAPRSTRCARTEKSELATGSVGHSVGVGMFFQRAAGPSLRGACNGCRNRLPGVTGVAAGGPHDGCRCEKGASTPPPRVGLGLANRSDTGASRGVAAIATCDTHGEERARRGEKLYRPGARGRFSLACLDVSSRAARMAQVRQVAHRGPAVRAVPWRLQLGQVAQNTFHLSATHKCASEQNAR